MNDRRRSQRRQRVTSIKEERRRIERRKEERRESPRVAVKMWIMDVETEEQGWEYFGNISMGGAFIETDTPPPIGKMVQIKLTNIDEEGDLIIKGEVVDIDINRGVRIKFIEGDFEQERRFARYLDELIRNGVIY